MNRGGDLERGFVLGTEPLPLAGEILSAQKFQQELAALHVRQFTRLGGRRRPRPVRFGTPGKIQDQAGVSRLGQDFDTGRDRPQKERYHQLLTPPDQQDFDHFAVFRQARQRMGLGIDQKQIDPLSRRFEPMLRESGEIEQQPGDANPFFLGEILEHGRFLGRGSGRQQASQHDKDKNRSQDAP